MKHFEWLCREIDTALQHAAQPMNAMERKELRQRMKDLSRRASLHLRDSVKNMDAWLEQNPDPQ